MAVNNIVLLPSTAGIASGVGDPIRAVGSLFTVSIYASNLQGRVSIEGTLVTNPKAEDWFTISPVGSSTDYVEFPRDDTTTVDGLQVYGFTFKGNFTWLRARLDRTYLNLPGNITDSQLAAYGYVDKVVLNIGGYGTDIIAMPDGTIVTGLESVKAYNLGTGTGVFASQTGQDNVVLSFKTLVEGEGIRITEDSTTITIENTGTGVGGGGTGGATRFVDLTDAPSVIVSKGLLVGTAGNEVAFTPAPTVANTVLVYDGGSFSWKDYGPTDTDPLPEVTGSDEYVYLQYSPGSAGTFNTGDYLISKTTGVTVSVVDATNCILAFTFTGRSFPPCSIALMGQAQQTNEFNYSNVNPSIGTRKIAGGGTAASPTLMGAFSGPITLQLRMSDTGASAAAGQRAKAIVLFKF